MKNPENLTTAQRHVVIAEAGFSQSILQNSIDYLYDRSGRKPVISGGLSMFTNALGIAMVQRQQYGNRCL